MPIQIFGQQGLTRLRHMENGLVTVWYVGTVLVGFWAVISPDTSTLSEFNQNLSMMWGMLLVVFGLGGGLARIASKYQAEIVALHVLSLAVAIQAFSVLYEGAAPLAGLRLLITPLMIEAYTVHRVRVTSQLLADVRGAANRVIKESREGDG